MGFHNMKDDKKLKLQLEINNYIGGQEELDKILSKEAQ